jgi:hypothetical protein
MEGRNHQITVKHDETVKPLNSAITQRLTSTFRRVL